MTPGTICKKKKEKKPGVFWSWTSSTLKTFAPSRPCQGWHEADGRVGSTQTRLLTQATGSSDGLFWSSGVDWRLSVSMRRLGRLIVVNLHQIQLLTAVHLLLLDPWWQPEHSYRSCLWENCSLLRIIKGLCSEWLLMLLTAEVRERGGCQHGCRPLPLQLKWLPGDLKQQGPFILPL